MQEDTTTRYILLGLTWTEEPEIWITAPTLAALIAKVEAPGFVQRWKEVLPINGLTSAVASLVTALHAIDDEHGAVDGIERLPDGPGGPWWLLLEQEEET